MVGIAPAVQCARKQQFIERLRISMDDIVALTAKAGEAAVINDQDVVKVFEERLEKARKRKDDLLAEYQRHISIHGC